MDEEYKLVQALDLLEDIEEHVDFDDDTLEHVYDLMQAIRDKLDDK